jgi:hypothetical protein
MNHVATTDANALPQMPAPPMSRALARAVELYDQPANDALEPLGAGLRSEAALLVALYDAALAQPPRLHVVRMWLARLVSAVRFAPAQEDFQHRALALHDVCLDEVPLSVFSAETQIAAMKKFTEWPSAADLLAFLRPYAATLRLRRRALHGLAEGQRSFYARWAPRGTAREAAQAPVAVTEVETALAAMTKRTAMPFTPRSHRVEPPAPMTKARGVSLSPAHMRAVWEQHLESPNPELREQAKTRIAGLDAQIAGATSG